MKSPAKRLPGASILLGLTAIASAVLAADTNQPPQLTFQLRDGSRVVGTSPDKALRFHSGTFGDFKAEVNGIRSLDFTSTNTAELKLRNGDAMTVDVSRERFTVKTSFGKVELTAGAVQRILVLHVASVGDYPAGLVALWQGDGNADDSVGKSHGVIKGDAGYAPGQVGQAFNFTSGSTYVKIPASPELDVGSGGGFTVAALDGWPTVDMRSPIFEWNNNDSGHFGVHLYVDVHSGGPGTLYANMVDQQGGWHYFYSAPGKVFPNQFQLVALTYDKASGEAIIYDNGVVVAQQNVGSFSPQTSYDLYLGKRMPTLTDSGLETFAYFGLMDQAMVFDRALSGHEMRMVCAQDNHGELPPPPPALTRRFGYQGVMPQ